MTARDLARRAVACPGWRWMSGMRASAPSAVPGGRAYGRLVLDANYIVRDHNAVLAVWHDHTRDLWLPDLTDPATLGCLLALVESTRGKTAPTLPHARQAYEAIRAWGLVSPQAAKALVAALEAADD